LQDTDNPVTICSKIPTGGLLWTSPSTTGGGRSSDTMRAFSVEMMHKAEVICSAQLQSGGAIHFASFSMVSNASSLTIGEHSKG